jgi:hypothetical protein
MEQNFFTKIGAKGNLLFLVTVGRLALMRLKIKCSIWRNAVTDA